MMVAHPTISTTEELGRSSHLGRLTDPSVDPMSPPGEPAVLFVPAIFIVGLALGAPMAVYTFGVITLGLEETGRHAGHLP